MDSSLCRSIPWSFAIWYDPRDTAYAYHLLTRKLGLDTTIAADVQGSVYQSLGEIEKLPWIGIGFPMGSVAVILLIGKMYGIFEIKWLIIASIVIFEAGSALCGAAPTANALIVGRAIAGVGGAGMYIG